MCLAIGGVGLMRAGIQVVGIAAASVIALMANHYISGDWSIEQHVSPAVCRTSLGETVQAVIPVSIARIPAAPLPLPTLGWMRKSNFATVVFPRAGSLYYVLHQLRSIELVAGRAWQGDAPPLLYS